MIEFGSDFHFVPIVSHSGRSTKDFFPSAIYYADGRQALIHLYHSQGWKRLWLPEYYCYDVVSSLKDAGLDLCFYEDSPEYHSDTDMLLSIQSKGLFRDADAVLRVNYFGMRSFRSSVKLSVSAVVEDHTHDLLGGWALNSSADYCFASLRKTLPIPEGGILWSPKGLGLPEAPAGSSDNERVATTRWEAMEMKTWYLENRPVEKSAFRSGYVDTECFFDTAQVSSLDRRSMDYLQSFNILDWYKKKYDNWVILSNIKKEGVRVLFPEDGGCYPFSLTLVFNDHSERERVRKALINRQVYPAVLWNVPISTGDVVSKTSRGLLSVHCDGRYSKDDIKQLKTIIESVL